MLLFPIRTPRFLTGPGRDGTIEHLLASPRANTNESAHVQALRQSASQSVNQTGQQVVGRYLNIQPTLTIRPGFPVRVIVNRDLVLEPYQG